MEITEFKKTEAQGELRVQRVNKKISQNKQATMIGISPATLTNVEHSRYDVINDATWRKIINFLSSPEWNIVNTHNFSVIQRMCGEAQFKHKLLSVIGYPGAGKTTSLSDYYRNNEKVYFMSARVGMNPKLFFNGLLKRMGVMFLASVDEMIERVASELNKQTDSLIIIDEAGKLTGRMLMHLHDLRDATSSTTGIILAGVNYFKSNLKKVADRGKQGMPEIFSRIMAWQELHRPRKNEKEAICIANGLEEEKKVKQVCLSQDFRQLSNQIINAKMQLDTNQ